MKRYLVVLTIAAFATGWAGDAKKIDLAVDGMHCDHCAERVKSALQKVKDVHDVEVSLKKGTVQVTLASTSATSSVLLAKTVADAGFAASLNDGEETRTFPANTTAHHDKDCVTIEGDHARADCSDERSSDCCAGKSSKMSKAKELKKK